MKFKTIIILCIALFAFSCSKDKGNYNYNELPEITAEGFPTTISVLSFLENIVIKPKLTSKQEGEITPDNPNYSFQYRIGLRGSGAIGGEVDGKPIIWKDISPNQGYNLDYPADLQPGGYICWLTITDKRNGVVTSFTTDVDVSSVTREGWMVLCNSGTNEQVRLDMISLLPRGYTAVHDVAAGLPTLHGGIQIGFTPPNNISLHTKEGGYVLDRETLASGTNNEFNSYSFVRDPQENMISYKSFSVFNDYLFVKHSFVVSDKGNAYTVSNDQFGAMYGVAINTPVAGNTPNYRVSPYIGFSQVRPANSTNALFYDIDNGRFLKFSSNNPNRLQTLAEPANPLFPFNNTGKKLIYMENTRLSNGLVYAIMEDNQGKRSICGINMGGSSGFNQELFIPEVNAPEFNRATQFAFHSRFPIMFYAVGSRLFLYNLGTGIVKELSNSQGGEITCLKFNLFLTPFLENLNKQTPEFFDLQFQLLMGTYDPSTQDGNGGKVGIYSVNGQNNSINKVSEYSGFSKVKDIVYRER